jgi:hypothetical protein
MMPKRSCTPRSDVGMQSCILVYKLYIFLQGKQITRELTINILPVSSSLDRNLPEINKSCLYKRKILSWQGKSE